MQSPSPEVPHVCEQQSCTLPSQLGGSLSCGPLSTAGHMLCTALQTTQQFINTAQIRLFMHHREAEIAHSTQPCNALGSRILPISPAKAGKASQLLGCLGLFASRALGIHPFAPGGDRTARRFTTSPSAPLPLEHSHSGAPSAPNPMPPSRLCGISPGPQTPRLQPLTTTAAPLPAATGVISTFDSLSPATHPLPGREPPAHACHTWLLAAEQEEGRSHAAPTRSRPTLPLPVTAAPRHGTTGSAQSPPEPRAVPPRSPPTASCCCAATAESSSPTSNAANSRSAGGGAMAAPAHGGSGAAAVFLGPLGWGGTDGGVPGAAPSCSAPGRGALRDPHARRRAGRGASPLPPSVPAASVRAQPRHAWAPPHGLGVGTGGSGVRGLFHGVGWLRWDRDAGRCVPASPDSPQRPRFGCLASPRPGWSITSHVCDVVPAHQKAKHGEK